MGGFNIDLEGCAAKITSVELAITIYLGGYSMLGVSSMTSKIEMIFCISKVLSINASKMV